ncbi:MAG TPA: glycosyltransferase family 4 protein [Verrucomicrobiae bacterium]|nr:glycosyltransferase family 4 protein [Verrucomicrobiae bacterium]
MSGPAARRRDNRGGGAALLAAFDFPPIVGGEATLYHGIARHLPPGEIVVWAPRLAGDGEIDAGLRCRVERGRVPAHGATFRRMARGLLAGAHLTRLLLRRPMRYLLCGQVLSLGVPMRLLASVFRLPYAVFVHGADVFDFRHRPVWARLIRWVLAGADAVIVNSRFTAGILSRDYPGAASRIVVLPMGVDVPAEASASEVAALRQRHALGDGPVLLTVARLVEAKGHDMVIEALPALLRRHPGLRYLVVGDGPHREALAARAARAGVAHAVVFTGRVPDRERAAHYALGTIFVLLSRSTGRYDGLEGFGLALLEASSHGLPVIGGRTGGIPEAVRDGGSGLVLPPEDPAVLAETIAALLDDPERRRRLGEYGRRFAAEHAWKRTAAAVRALWRQPADEETPPERSDTAAVVGGRAERCAASPAP